MTNSRYFIEIVDFAFGYTAATKLYMPLPKEELDLNKCLKKWYNHLTKIWRPDVDVHAMREDEDGSYSDLTVHWGCEYLDHLESVGLLP